jgi:hypothetical protein
MSFKSIILVDVKIIFKKYNKMIVKYYNFYEL